MLDRMLCATAMPSTHDWHEADDAELEEPAQLLTVIDSHGAPMQTCRSDARWALGLCAKPGARLLAAGTVLIEYFDGLVATTGLSI